jgi:hypothetical protein
MIGNVTSYLMAMDRGCHLPVVTVILNSNELGDVTRVSSLLP